MTETTIAGFRFNEFITIAVVFAGIFGAIYSANRSFRQSVLSKNRQEWINELRSCIANLTSQYEFTSVLRKKEISLEFDEGNVSDAAKMFIDAAFEIQRSFDKIRLLINPNEEYHQELIRLMRGVNIYDESDVLDQKIDVIIDCSQMILKTEWERVKKGD